MTAPVAPAWLPNLIPVGGDWNALLGVLYLVFERDIKNGKPRVSGVPVWWDRRLLPGETYEEGFWHLITKDDREHGRIPDFRRAERLAWCGAVIANCGDAAVTSWRYLEGNGRPRRYLWLQDHDYVVVLEERATARGAVLVLLTSYHIDGPSGRRSLTRKFEKRIV